jgi:MFS family permease
MTRKISLPFLKFLVVILAFQDVAAGVAGSIMADLIEAFPDFSPTTVMLVATIPGLFQIFPALFYGKLTTVFKKRTLLFTGLIMFIVGGTAPFFLDNLPLIIATRAILGLGTGITIPLSVDIITDFFEGRERDFLIGFGTSSIACIGAIFFQLVGGILADAYGWNYGFLTYLFPLWILAITFLYLPEPEKKKAEEQTVKVKTPFRVYMPALGQLLYSAMIYGYVINISVVIQAENLGTATQAGLAISIYTLGTLLAGFVFGRYKHALPRVYIPLAILLTSFGMFFCYFSPTLMTIFIGSLIGGFGMGLGLPGIFAKVSELTPKGAPPAVGFVVVGQGLGGIVGPYIFEAVQTIMNQDIGRFPLVVSAVGMLILAVVWGIISLSGKTKQDMAVSA